MSGALSSADATPPPHPHPRSSYTIPVDSDGYTVLPYMDLSTLYFLPRPSSPPPRFALIHSALSLLTDSPPTLTHLESTYRHHHSTSHSTRLRCSLIALAAALWSLHSLSSPSSHSLAFITSLAVLPALTLHVDVFSPAFRLPLLLSLLATFACFTPGWTGYGVIQLALVAGIRPPFPLYSLASTLLTLTLAGHVLLTATSFSSTFPLLLHCLPLLVLLPLFYLSLLAAYSLETTSRTSFWLTSAASRRQDLLPPALPLHSLLPFLHSSPHRDSEPLPPPPQPSYTPIFISGFHRSGTTFLYDELLRILPGQVAHLSPYELLMFPHLLQVEASGKGAEARDALDRWWKAVGVRDRGMDRAVVTATSPPEEYCFVLMSQWGPPLPTLRLLTHRGNGQQFEHLARISADSHDTFHRLCLKLLHIQRPRHAVVLMKNPFEYGNEAEVLRHFPSARFIHIRRQPLEVLSSQCATTAYHVGGVGGKGEVGGMDPYLWTLLLGWPRLGLCEGRLRWVLARMWAGEAGVRAGSMRHLVGRFVEGAVWAKETYAQLPAGVACEVRYESLVQRPREVLEGIVRFMGLQEGLDRAAMQEMKAERSKARLCDEVRKAQPWILEQLRKRGVQYDEAHTGKDS